MEQQSSINRLYWLNANGDWELVLEDAWDQVITLRANEKMQSSLPGVVGYAKYPAAPEGMRWTRYMRYEGGCRRDPSRLAEVPQSIQLLEMLLCN